jgi:hypothetical protein
MLLEKLLEKPESRESIFIGAIDETVKMVTRFVKHKENRGQHDEAYQNSLDFLSYYRTCSWEGRATPQFINGLKDYVVPALIERAVKKKVVPYLLLCAAGLGAVTFAFIFGKHESAWTWFTVAGGVITAASSGHVCYSTGKQINKDIYLIKEAFEKYPTELNIALRYLYERKKNE